MGFLEALSALGGAAGGAAQGMQQEKELKLKQAEQARLRAVTNQEISANIVTQLQLHPELATNVNYVKITSHMAKQNGLDLPRTPAGGIDVEALGAGKKDVMDALTPDQLVHAREAPTDVQKAWAAQYGDKNNFFGEGENRFKQEIPAAPRTAQDAMDKIVTDINRVGEGKMTAGVLSKIANLEAHNIPGFDANAFVESLPQFTQIAPDTIARLNRYKDEHTISEYRLKTLVSQISNAHSLEDFRKFEEDNFHQMSSVRMGDLQEMISRDQANEADADSRVSIQRSHLQLDVQKATKDGAINTPIKTIDKEASGLQDYIRVLQAQQTAARNEASKETEHGTDMNDDGTPNTAFTALHAHIDDLEEKIRANTEILTNVQSHRKELYDASLRSMGINVKKAPRDDTQQDPLSSVRDIAGKIPKAQRLQLFQASNMYKNMKPDEQKAAVQAIQTMP
jgi:hypothetical protein